MGGIIKRRNNFLQSKENLQYITWKAVPLLQKYVTRFDELKPRKFSKHPLTAQKHLRKAVIRAREIGIMAYVR